MTFPTTIAYNMEDKKIGCVLMQPLMGAMITGGDVSANFSSECWDLSPAKLKLYTVNNASEWDQIKKMTNAAHRK